MPSLRVVTVYLLVLVSVGSVCVEGAEGGIATGMYSIGSSDLQVLVTGATFRAYENAWTVDMGRQEADVNIVLFFAVCEGPCSRDGETNRWQADRYYTVDCDALLLSLTAPPWHNAYLAAQAADAAADAAAGPAFRRVRTRATSFRSRSGSHRCRSSATSLSCATLCTLCSCARRRSGC